MNMIANDNRLRRQEIMLRLLDYETLSYQKLSDQYFVSRSSLSNDFNLIKHFSKRMAPVCPLIIQVPSLVVARFKPSRF